MDVRADERPLDEPALAVLLAGLDGWHRDSATITKTFTFKGFKGAIAFVRRVADAADAADHHPDIHVERYREVRIVLTTHAIGGLSRADMDLARAIDAVEAPPARDASPR